MSKNVKPTQQSLAKWKRFVRYLKRERQWCPIFSFGRMVEEVTTFTDSDWAGRKETRQSSNAGLILLGNHALKAYTLRQNIIASMSAGTDLFSAALCASQSKGIVSLFRDLSYETKPVLAIDAYWKLAAH